MQTQEFYVRDWMDQSSCGLIRFHATGVTDFKSLTEDTYKKCILKHKKKLFVMLMKPGRNLPFQATILHRNAKAAVFYVGRIKQILTSIAGTKCTVGLLVGALAQLDEEIVERCKDGRLNLDEIDPPDADGNSSGKGPYAKIAKLKNLAEGTTHEPEKFLALQRAIQMAGKILRNGEEI